MSGTYVARRGDSGASYPILLPNLNISGGGAQVIYLPRPVKILRALVFAAVAVDNGNGTPTYALGTAAGGQQLVTNTAIADLTQYAVQELTLTAAAGLVSGAVHFTVNNSGTITGTVQLVLEVVNL